MNLGSGDWGGRLLLLLLLFVVMLCLRGGGLVGGGGGGACVIRLGSGVEVTGKRILGCITIFPFSDGLHPVWPCCSPPTTRPP